MSSPAEVSTITRFRRVAGRFPTGVTILGTVVAGEPHAMTVNSFTSISLDPQLVLVSVSTGSRTCGRIERSGAFAVTVLGADQQHVARRFAVASRPAGERAFEGVPWRPAPHSGSPILVEGLGYFDCVVDRIDVLGDHTVVIGAVLSTDVLSDRPPLLFFQGRFAQLPDQCWNSGEA